MNISNDMTVYVYRFTRSEFLKSAHSKLETLIEGYPLVAYSDELELLFQSVEPYQYSTAQFIQDTIKIDPQEMTYIEYVRMYKEMLNKVHADAPVLNLETDDSTDSNELPSNPYERLVKLGVRFS